ncbi:uncharacterized protein PHACADRAFT_201721 [Phanerochaete carnosa HHB-10118-sp]|uniref:Uncharacterized protein n=1 Tax=Phanerochaete carnosa (strain HHB-10118-sp) TaxID=650164 RepID=K5VSB7_PHACS|nr:uncharacterized protein PHACADRAFT_201721 [Phanerochaete carnosa HHB-10118-sp]EKM49459.1 hypothetical protein PHACADRAFT_201721 [Phanerochaete carnosa HHB-10118-sp]
MPPSPNEWMDLTSIPTETFFDHLYFLKERTPAEDRDHTHVQFALAGRYKQPDGRTLLVKLDTPPAVANGVEKIRRLGAMLGTSRKFPCSLAMDVLRLPHPKWELNNEQDLTKDFTNSYGAYSNIPLQNVPHISFALGSADNTKVFTWLCLPELYYKGCSPRILRTDLYHLYLTALHPAYEASIPNLTPLPKVTKVEDFVSLSTSAFEEFSCSLTVEEDSLSTFTETLFHCMDADDIFRGAYFVHHVSPRTIEHCPTSQRERNNAWLEARGALDELPMDKDIDGWEGNVQLLFRKPGAVLLWQHDAIKTVLNYLLPDMDEEEIANLVDERKSSSAAATFTFGNTIVNLSSAGLPITRLEFHTKDYSTAPAGWRTFGTDDTFPSHLAVCRQSATKAQKTCFQFATADSPTGDVECRLTVHGKLEGLKNTLSSTPASSSLFYEISKRGWWRFRGTRIFAANIVLKSLKITPKDARVWPTVLGLAAIAIHIINTCIQPQVESAALHQTLYDAAYQIAPDASNAVEADWAEAAETLEPFVEQRGAYFMADVMKNLHDEGRGYFLRLPQSYAELASGLVDIYNQQSMSDLRREFGLGSHQTHIIIAPSIHRLSKGRDTALVQHTWQRPLPPPLTFELADVDIRIRSVTALTGVDARDNEDEEYDRLDDMLQGTLIDILNRIYLQLCHDLMAKSPNARGGGAYTTVTRQELFSIPPGLYLQPELPFERICIELCDRDEWIRTVHNLLPRKGYITPPKAMAYPKSTYYKAWIALLDRMNPSHAAYVTKKMRAEISKFLWLPKNDKNSMWITQSNHPTRSITLGDEDRRSCPVLVVNPIYVHSVEELGRFVARDL